MIKYVQSRDLCPMLSHKVFKQSPKALEDFVLFQMESIRCLLADGVDKVVIVFDMTGFGIRNVSRRET